MSTETNRAIARRYLEEIDRGNLAALDEVLADDYNYHIPISPQPLNREQHRQFLTTFYSAFPDLVHTIQDQVAEGDRVATRALTRGTHQGELMGIPPTGKQIAIMGMNIVRIANGRIKDEWALFDMLGLMQQLGAVPASMGA